MNTNNTQGTYFEGMADFEPSEQDKQALNDVLRDQKLESIRSKWGVPDFDYLLHTFGGTKTQALLSWFASPEFTGRPKLRQGETEDDYWDRVLLGVK